MARYWVFHDRRLKGPLDPNGLKELAGFAADTRVCPEGGPETDWRPAREHAELTALFQKPGAVVVPASASAPMPSIPKLTPLPPLEPLAAPEPLSPAIDPQRVDALEHRVAEQQRALDEHARLLEDLRRGKIEAERRIEELASAVASAREQLSRLESAPPAPIPPAPAPIAEPEKVEEAPLPLPPPFTPIEREPQTPLAKKETPAEDRTVVLSAAEFAPLKKETPHEDKTIVLPNISVPASSSSRRLKILSADDDELMRQAIATTFKKAGHEVDLASDGAKALEMIATNPYDIVILDESMPSSSGFQVARAISKVDADSRPKVLIFTSQPVENKLARETFLMSGADDVMAKEKGMAALLKKVHELTGIPAPD